MNQELVDFYSDVGRDSKGRKLQDILAWEDPNEWEKCHDFIQWVFPLPEPSRFNPDAPLLDAETLQVFRTTPRIYRNVTKAYLMAHRFLFVKEPTWLEPGDHNHLRITRIIRFLNLMGSTKMSSQIHKHAVELAEANPGAVSKTTLEFWRQASLPIV